MFRRTTAVATLAVSLAAGATNAHTGATTSAERCGTSCRAAYDAIARALPRDRGNILLSTLLHTRGFDWTMLAGSLHVPTARQIHEEWRRECEQRFAGDPASAAACYRLIFGP